MIEYNIIAKNGKLQSAKSYEEASEKAKGGNYIWVALHNPEKEDFAVMEQKLFINNQSIEECHDDNLIPKIFDSSDYTHTLFNTFHYEKEQMIIEEVNIFIANNFIVTVTKSNVNDNFIKNIKELIELDKEIIKQGPAYFMCTVINYVEDSKFSVIEAIEDKLEELEDSVLERRGDFNHAVMQKIGRELSALHKSLFHEREILMKILRKDIRFIPEKALINYNNIYDHIIKFFELSETYREMVNNLLQTNLALLNNEMAKAANLTNKTVKRLTLITTIFMPLSLIAGIGGMSEWSKIIGITNHTVSFSILVALLTVIAFANYYLLKWLDKKDKRQ